jgi:hypothetical protein
MLCCSQIFIDSSSRGKPDDGLQKEETCCLIGYIMVLCVTVPSRSTC